MWSLLRTDLEYIIHCDINWKIIGPISKTHAHLPWVRETLFHYVTWSMVYNPILWKYWIQLKNPKKNDSSQWWIRDMWVAWHNCYTQEEGEYKYLGFDQNLEKEANEEIWIHLRMLNDIESFRNKYNSGNQWSIWYIFEVFPYNTKYDKERVGLWFIATSETELHFNDGEVVDFKRYSPNELLDFITSDKNSYSPTLKISYKKAERFRKEVLSS